MRQAKLKLRKEVYPLNEITAKSIPHIAIKLKPNARSTRITLRRSARDGGFIVSYPKRLPLYEVQSFVDAHEGWLLKHYEPNESIEFGSEILFRGEPFVIAPGEKRGVSIGNGVITVKSTNLGRAVGTAFKLQAQSFALERVDHYAQKVGSHVNEVRWRDPKSRWGSCDTRGNIMLSWRLIMTPDWVFDYVIAHECAHLIHMDHSSKFWSLVENIFPEYKAAKSYLRREGSELQKISFSG